MSWKGAPPGDYRWRIQPIVTKDLTAKPGVRVTEHLAAGEVHLYYLDVDHVVSLSGLPKTCNDLVWQHADTDLASLNGTNAFGWVDEQGPMCDQGRKLFVGNDRPDRRIVLVIRGKDLTSSGDYSFQID